MCKNNINDQHPDIINRVEKIFAEAHTDNEWYRNPGESDEDWKAKSAKAEKEGSLQTPTRANTTFKLNK